MRAPRHQTLTITGDYRMIVISDIHGHDDRFRLLLKQVNYDPAHDYLIILGDFVEKGDQVLETIHHVMELSRNPRCYVLMGNCEWAMTAILSEPELAQEITRYLRRVPKNGVIRHFYELEHLADGHETPLGIQRVIASHLEDELRYFNTLPVTLKVNDMIFVHAGLPEKGSYKKGTLPIYLETQAFMRKGHSQKEMVIVGHFPTANYDAQCIDNNILIDWQKRIISIDGGTGVKPISQLNALIITSQEGRVTYDQSFVQPLPYGRVTRTITPEEKTPHKISFPHYEVTILQTGEDFSLCRHKATGESFDIKNEFLYEAHGHTYCLDDYTDARLAVTAGELIRIAGVYHNYIYARKGQSIGWVLADAVEILRENVSEL